MGYGSRSGRAHTSSSNPRAHAICDRCGFRYNHDDLQWQYDWSGASLINRGILVCSDCMDVPQEQLRAIIVPADPVPIQNPRIEYFNSYSSNNRLTSQAPSVDAATGISSPRGSTRVTQDEATRSTQMTGEAPGGRNTLPGTDPNAVTYRTVTNAQNNGNGLIRLTVATTNGMLTNQLVTVQDVGGISAASGNWKITVINATQIDLQSSVFSGTYTSGGYVVNNPSLPYNFTQVPKTGTL